MASGVSTGKICSRKWRAISSAGASDSSQLTIRMPCSASSGWTTSENWRACRRSRSRHLLGDAGEDLGRGQAVGTAGVDSRVDLVVHAGHADHEELVEVRDEDGQELHPLHQRQRLVLGELQYAVVEVEPGELAVEVTAMASARLASVLLDAERPSASASGSWRSRSSGRSWHRHVRLGDRAELGWAQQGDQLALRRCRPGRPSSSWTALRSGRAAAARTTGRVRPAGRLPGRRSAPGHRTARRTAPARS